MRNADRTITLYNYGTEYDTGYDVAYRTLIPGVSVYSKTQVSVDENGMHSADSTVIRIPVESLTKEFLRPNAYEQESDHSAYFTLQKGDKIVLGVAAEENPRKGELEQTYGDDYCLTIIGVTDNRNKREPHFKVVCE